jgi:putative transposase
VDNYTRESLAIEVGQNLKGEDVVNTLNRIASQRGLSATVKVDNGSEFISKVMDKWAYERGIELDFSRPGKRRTTPRWKAPMDDCARRPEYTLVPVFGGC